MQFSETFCSTNIINSARAAPKMILKSSKSCCATPNEVVDCFYHRKWKIDFYLKSSINLTQFENPKFIGHNIRRCNPLSIELGFQLTARFNRFQFKSLHVSVSSLFTIIASWIISNRFKALISCFFENLFLNSVNWWKAFETFSCFPSHRKPQFEDFMQKVWRWKFLNNKKENFWEDFRHDFTSRWSKLSRCQTLKL